MTRSLSRRDVLALLGAGLAVAATGVTPLSLYAAVRPVARPASSAELETWVSTQLGQSDVRSIASAWKAKHATDSTAQSLAQRILAERRRGEALEAYLARMVASEHAAGRAESVDGWYLAPTEARLATLADLLR